MLTDLDLDSLRTYRPEPTAQDDFDRFWADTLAGAAEFDLEARFDPMPTGLATIDSYDVAFRGYGGQVIRGWLNLPRHREHALPCVVEYLGYTGGRGNPQDWLLWSAAGYAHLVMDTRGQGGGFRRGDTPDTAAVGSPHAPGFATLGIESAQTYYYRRMFVDAVRAIEAARAAPWVDPDRVVVAGASQGGGVAIAAAALSGNVRAALPSVPFLCNVERGSQIVDTVPYVEISRFLRAAPQSIPDALRVLSYFDGMNHATRAAVPALFSVALMDQVCPPSTVFAAYNHWAGPKDIRVWPYSDHDGAVSHHSIEQVAFLERLFSAPDAVR